MVQSAVGDLVFVVVFLPQGAQGFVCPAIDEKPGGEERYTQDHLGFGEPAHGVPIGEKE